jgi:hypothetical protein
MTWFEIFAFFGGPLLILAIGLVVDDAILVVENVQRPRLRGERRLGDVHHVTDADPSTAAVLVEDQTFTSSHDQDLTDSVGVPVGSSAGCEVHVVDEPAVRSR